MKSRLLALSLASLLVLAGCSAGVTEVPSMEMSSDVSAERSVMAGDSANVDRSVIRSAFITLETEDLVSGITEVERIVGANAGYLDSWSESSNNAGEAWAYFATIRVPNISLDKSLTELRLIGTVTEQQLSSQDVTTQVLDLEARIKSLTESIGRLQELLTKANTTSELIEIENALASRQAELESLQAQSEYLNSLVDFSTINLSLYLKDRGPQAEPANFLEGIQYGFDALVAFFAGALVTAGFVVPWLIIALPLLGILGFGLRKLAKRKR
jgi:hypothetical protein